VRLPLIGLISAAALAMAAPASAQFELFSRCQTAYPCNQPFHLQYRPDPLFAGPWSKASPASAVSAHIELKSPPSIGLDKPKTPATDDPVNNSVRYFLRKYPPVLNPRPPDSPDS
jgi:hypothetical protein